MSKNIGKYISKNLSSKYSQNFLDHSKKSATDALKTASKRAIQKTAEATGDLIGNMISNKITKTSPQNTSKTVESETKISKKRYISPEERQNIIDELRFPRQEMMAQKILKYWYYENI